MFAQPIAAKFGWISGQATAFLDEFDELTREVWQGDEVLERKKEKKKEKALR